VSIKSTSILGDIAQKLDVLRRRYIPLMLFQSFVRTDDASLHPRESAYAFHNRSSWPECEAIRQLLESLFSEYPEKERAELRARIVSGDDQHFRSATFELVLHAYLQKAGFRVEVHPPLSNGLSARPDFKVTGADNMAFYLEARLCGSKFDAEENDHPLISTTLDYLTQRTHQNFFVGVKSIGFPTTQPSSKKLGTEILKWLDTLDVDDVTLKMTSNSFHSLPEFSWSHENLTFSFRAIPIPETRRGMAKNLVATRSTEGHCVDDWSPIRDAITFKGNKYGKLDCPLVIAVNSSSFSLDQIDEMQALFGQEVMVYHLSDPNTEPSKPTSDREPNGAWNGQNGPQYTRVSGAWLFKNLSISSLAASSGTLYLNPWATLPLTDCVKVFPHADPVEGEMKHKTGLTIRDALGLPTAWPNGS
jgi:hypothetical protein